MKALRIGRRGTATEPMPSCYLRWDREVEHGALGVSRAPSDVERGRPEKAAPGQSLCGSGISAKGERLVPAALRGPVGAANDRSPCSMLPNTRATLNRRANEMPA